MHSKYSIAAARANRICEYCNAPEIISNVAFEVDYTTPLSKGGTDDLENLALCCRICNLRKSDHTTAIDPLTQTIVSLFNPRQHSWSDHLLRQRLCQRQREGAIVFPKVLLIMRRFFVE